MPANVGNQKISSKFKFPANSDEVNLRFKSIRPLGVYCGGWLSKSDDSHAIISTFVCEISDGTYQVRIETQEAITLAVTTAIPYIVCRWSYTGNTQDYAEILAVTAPQSNDLIFGKCTFVGSALQDGFVYDDSNYPRTNPEVQALFLKVEPSDLSELKVRIRGGRIQNNSSTIHVPDQKSTLFVAPTSTKKIYLVYINLTTGAISVDSSGTESTTPSAPSYAGKLVLAEITLTSTDTSIPANKIKDVRPFLVKQIVPDMTTIDFDSNGKLYLKSIPSTLVPSVVPAKVDSIFGPRTILDSIGSVLVKDKVYKVTSDGSIIAFDETPQQNSTISIYTDGNNPPTERYSYDYNNATGSCSGSCLVRKGDYWKVTGTATKISWLPIGNTGQCVKQ